MPDKDYLTCSSCGFRGVINFKPMLDKCGLPHGLSRPEKRQFGRHLKADLEKI